MYDALVTPTPSIPVPSARQIRTRRCAPWLAAVLALACLGPAAAADDIADGTLLVASADLKDPNFSRTVVLILRHDEDGTVGLIVNRPTTLEPRSVFPEVADDLGHYAGSLYRGGPVAPTRLLFLVRGLAAATVEGPEIVDKVFLSADPQTLPDMARLANGTRDLRLYAGHAEWVAGQIEGEIAAGSWTTVTGNAELVFRDDPLHLWTELAARANATVAALRDR
jgi:putative transcriptional regulator